MVFGRRMPANNEAKELPFQFPVGIRWCSDNYALSDLAMYGSFNSLWELDGVRTFNTPTRVPRTHRAFNSLWELDGVRTKRKIIRRGKDVNFQFPVGIRWCSDEKLIDEIMKGRFFQFPVGIRWCSDASPKKKLGHSIPSFNSLWELDGVRT